MEEGVVRGTVFFSLFSFFIFKIGKNLSCLNTCGTYGRAGTGTQAEWLLSLYVDQNALLACPILKQNKKQD